MDCLRNSEAHAVGANRPSPRLCLFLLLALSSYTHDRGASTAVVKSWNDRVEAVATFASSDLVDLAPLDLDALATDGIAMTSGGDLLIASLVAAHTDQNDNFEIHLTLPVRLASQSTLMSPLKSVGIQMVA
jgi:hypothetical protein